MAEPPLTGGHVGEKTPLFEETYLTFEVQVPNENSTSVLATEHQYQSRYRFKNNH